MKKTILLMSFIIIFLMNSVEIIECIHFSFNICINNLFPSLIPFMLLSNILMQYNFTKDINSVFGKSIKKIFGVDENCAFSILMSIISGCPSNSKYLHDSVDNNIIDDKNCEKCLKFCHFINPIFILGTVGYTFFKDKRLGLIILISHYISSIIIGLLNRKNKTLTNKNFNSIHKNNKNFINILTSSINNTINTLLLILGIITTCLIVTTILNKIFIINNDFKFIYGIIEITQGLKYLSYSNISITLKVSIASFLISFGGICIHMQVFSILDNKKIRYLPYFISRVLHGIISFIITYIIIAVLY